MRCDWFGWDSAGEKGEMCATPLIGERMSACSAGLLESLCCTPSREGVDRSLAARLGECEAEGGSAGDAGKAGGAFPDDVLVFGECGCVAGSTCVDPGLRCDRIHLH